MLTQTRIGLDRVRLATEAAAIGAWEMNEGAKVGVRAAEAEVRAATIVLEGVQRETRVGQRSFKLAARARGSTIAPNRSAARPPRRVLHAAERRRQARSSTPWVAYPEL